MEGPQQPTIKKQKGKRSAKKAEDRQTGKKDPYAYTLKDKTFGEFKVLNSANGWWTEKEKVQHLIDAYKIDANDEEACAYAGISFYNLKYFKEQHPEFLLVKRACQQVLGLKAKQAIANKVEQNPEWYLERKRKDEYSPRQEQTGADGRELYEGLSEDLRNLGEEIRNINNGNEKPTTKEHPGDDNDGASDAGTDGDRNEAGTTPAIGSTEEVHA